MKTIVYVFLVFIFTFVLTANAAQAQTTVQKSKGDKKMLIAYFSITQTTQELAQMIKDNTGADLFRIESKKPYPADYKTLTDLGKKEQAQNARPALASNIKNIGRYDVIFIGFPTWWHRMPMILYTFLESHDLSGKTIVLFNTHGGGGFPPDAVSEIERLQPKAIVEKKVFSVSARSVKSSEDDLKKRLKELGFLR
jgi:flavodoxin